MKYLILACLLSFSALAQDLTFDEAMSAFDQHRDSLSKVEVGLELLNESYEIHGECTHKEKIISTIVDLYSEYALVLNERRFTPCNGVEEVKRFLSRDYMVNFDSFKAEALKTFKTWKADLKGNILTFKQKIPGHEYTMQYDLNSNLFTNWVHYHHSYSGVEDHNIRYGLKKRIIPLSEIQGLPFCERSPLSLEIINCSDSLNLVDLEISPIISGELQKLVNGLPAGDYAVRVSVLYRYSLSPTATVSLPVALTNLSPIVAPSKIESCKDTETSLSCSLSGTMNLWFNNYRPVPGDFVLDFQVFRPNGILIKETKGFLIKSAR